MNTNAIDIFDAKSPRLSPKNVKRVKQLERIIPILDTFYELGDDCIHPDTIGVIVSDIEYDAMRSELRRLKPDSFVFSDVTASTVVPNARHVTHYPPMTSIAKANGTKQEKETILLKWIKDRTNGKDPSKVLVSAYKRDGVACALYYKDGKLTGAGLRPRDGVTGEDITLNVVFVKGVPKTLPEVITCSIRGELECLISVFNNLNETDAVEGKKFANPRNYTAGSIRQFKNPKKTRSRSLEFTAYSIEGLENPPYSTEIERAKWCRRILGIPFVEVRPYNVDDLAKMESGIDDLDYEVDGIVISINNLEEQEQSGRHGDTPTGNPRGKLAWKFADDTADPIIEAIVWETGRTGQVTPVLTFKPVKLAGTMVSRCAAHSLGFLLRNKISDELNNQTKIRIRKSGKIIPETIGSYINGEYATKIEAGDSKLPDNFDDIDRHPKKCSSCRTELEVKKGQTHGIFELVCTNNKECPAQNIKKFMNYLDKFGVKGIGESMVTKLVESSTVKSFADFYRLSVSNVRFIGISLRMSLLTIAQIHMVQDPEQEKDNRRLANRTIRAIKDKKVIPLAKFIACLGITGASQGTGRTLATHFGSFDKILLANQEEFITAPDVGSKTAASLANYFLLNINELKDLLQFIELDLPKQGKFSGKTFVFTGGLSGGKDLWKKEVEDLGAKVSGSVSKKTDYVIVGTDPGAKYDKAKSLVASGTGNVKIIEDFEEFKSLLEN